MDHTIDIPSVRARFRAVRDGLTAAYKEREGAVECIVLAALAGCHALLVGLVAVWQDLPTGQKPTVLQQLQINAANVVGFAILWAAQFFVLDKISFKPHHLPTIIHADDADAPVAALSPILNGALELLSLSLVAPAALVLSAPGAEILLPGLLSVALAHVRAYRAARIASLRIVGRAQTPLEGAPNSEFVVFRGGEGLRDQVAIVVGAPDFAQPVTVRLHSACLTGDLFGSLKCDCGDQLRNSVRLMASNGGGVLLYLDQEGRANGLSNKIRAYDLQAQGYDTYEADEALGFEHDQRRFDFAAEMLKQLGVTCVRLLTNNPVKIEALKEAGLDVVSDHRILGRRNDHNLRYLAAKRDQAGHLLEEDR